MIIAELSSQDMISHLSAELPLSTLCSMSSSAQYLLLLLLTAQLLSDCCSPAPEQLGATPQLQSSKKLAPPPQIQGSRKLLCSLQVSRIDTELQKYGQTHSTHKTCVPPEPIKQDICLFNLCTTLIQKLHANVSTDYSSPNIMCVVSH